MRVHRNIKIVGYSILAMIVFLIVGAATFSLTSHNTTSQISDAKYAPIQTIAASKFDPPGTVCNYLENIGLPTDGWKNFGSDDQPDFGCASHPRLFDVPPPVLQNGLSYYADGTEDRVTKVYLQLTVTDESNSKLAHRALGKAADTLFRAVTASPLPNAIVDGLRNNNSTAIKIGRFNVSTSVYNWPTGRGYEENFNIE